MSRLAAIVEALRVRGLLRLVDETVRPFFVTREDALGRSRTLSVARARKAVYVALREKGLSYTEIGRLVGRDHTTVVAGVRSVSP